MTKNFDYIIDLFCKNLDKYRALNPIDQDSIPQNVQNHISDINSKSSIEEKRSYIKSILSEFKVKNFEKNDKVRYEELFIFYRDVVSKIVVLENNADFEQQRNESIDNKKYKDKSGNSIFTNEEKYKHIVLILMNYTYEDLKNIKNIKKENDITKKEKGSNIYRLKAEHKLDKDAWKANLAAVKKYKQNTIICPYCNISYLNYSEGYSQLDHIYPHSIFPMLKYSPINLVSCCGSCNNKKNNAVINFSVEDLINLHKNEFSKEKLKLEFKPSGNLEDVIEPMKLVSGKHESDNDEFFDLLKVETFIYSKEENFKKLNISARYNTLKPILVRITRRFYENERKIREMIQIHRSNIEENDYESIFKEQLFINLFDEWYTNALIERDQVEVILYFRLEYIKHLIKQYK